MRTVLRTVALVSAFLASSVPGVAQTPIATTSPTPAPSPTVIPHPAYTFDTPTGWRQFTRAGTQYIIIVGFGRDTQLIGIGAIKPQADLVADAQVEMDRSKAAGAQITDDGPTTVCDGRPAYEWVTRQSTGVVPTISRTVVTHISDGDGIVQYTHIAAVGDRNDAIAALQSLCPLPFHAPTIPGWIVDPVAVGLVSARSPDGSSFYGGFRRLQREAFSTAYPDPPGTHLVSSSQPDCSTGELIRRDVTDGRKIFEIAEGYVSGYAYEFTYERSATTPASADAEAALSSICHLPAM